MSSGARALAPRAAERDVGRPEGRGRGRVRAPALGARRALGLGGLAAVGAGSLWLAVAASRGRYLLELPTRVRPAWIAGPLHGLSGLTGPPGPLGFDVAVVVIGAGYLVALLCADAIPPRAAWGAVVVATLAFVLGPTIVSSDVFGYIGYARELARGVNPYLAPPASLGHDGIVQFVYWKHETSPYGPLFTLLSAGLGTASPALALWVLKAVAGAASLALTWLVSRIAKTRRSSPVAAAIFVGLNPVLLLYAVSGAHNDLLATLLVLAGVALVCAGRESLGAGAAVAAAAVKLTLGVALPFVLLGARRARPALRGAVLAGAAIGMLTVLVFGGHVLDQLHRIAGGARFDTAGSGPDVLAGALGRPIDATVRALCTGAAALVALAMLASVRRGADWVSAAGWASLALIASIASLAPWYLVWLLPLAALGRSRGLRLAALAATVYLIAIHLPALGGEPWLSSAAGR